MAKGLAWLWVAAVGGLVLTGCVGGWDEGEERGGGEAPSAGAQGAKGGGKSKAYGPSGISKPRPEPVIRRLGPGDVCVGVFGLCDPGLSCVDGICCTSKCGGSCERCDQELRPSEVGEEPRFSGNCTPIEDCSECIRHVNGKVPSSGNGESWDEAFQTVQEGIDAAYAAVQADPGLDSCEVWVARGTYYIYVSDPLNTVQLEPGAHVYGGFVGTETEREQRDWGSNATVLSGYDQPGGQSRVYHVVTGSDDAVLDGLTVTGGQANGSWPHTYGGGMYNDAASPTVRNCTFSGNFGHYGGGMYNYHTSFPTVTSCTFSGNYADLAGGGMCNGASYATVTSCTFSGNSSYRGGGIYNSASSPPVASCTFSGNTASYRGGGMDNVYSSSPTVTNCVLWGDTAPDGPEIYNDGSSTSVVTYSNVQGGYAGDGNINADPLFAAAPNDLHIGAGSPCIDAANGDVAPEHDKDGNPRVDDPGTEPNTGTGDPDYVDMGAYEYQPSW